ncbi:TrmH family RNA methyltransferase [Criblamydia sequanensis]|uniref:rRNA methylase n=1 Tax=Candidatus Criblamydia sequanensis CRIB-18 TaxID=1437425 RepID=A0A090DYV8_9BACT|nr:RNA methyltransferase [Criblamydia sequanensis]CDR33884.1 rRNA methylase [Criblamydia sequanensis CRIB-18]
MEIPKKFQDLLSLYRNETIIRLLSEWTSPNRLEKIDQVLDARLHGLQVAIESPSDLHNASASTRSCEAFGVYQVHVISSEVKKTSGKSASQGAWKWTFVHKHKNTQDFISEMKRQGVLLAGASLKGKLSLEKIPVDKPLCLLFGNEDRGLSEEALSSCEYEFTIPMQGMMESLNLSVAVGISVYETAKRMRPLQAGEALDANTLKAIYLIQAIGIEKAKLLLKRGLA